VEVAGHQSADITLTPARGTYRLRCTHALHTAFGMSGEIVVE
jgi:plastocyanin